MQFPSFHETSEIRWFSFKEATLESHCGWRRGRDAESTMESGERRASTSAQAGTEGGAASRTGLCH